MKQFLCWSVLCVGLAGMTAGQAQSLVLATEEAPPFNYLADDGKTVVGSATELIHALFKRAHVPYTITLFPWARALEMARSETNTCVYSTTRTPEREHSFVWVGPVARNDWVLFARADRTIQLTTLEDAKKYKIGGYLDDAITLHLQAQKFPVDVATKDTQTAQKLESGRVDLWATGGTIGPHVANKLKIKIKPVLNFKATELYLACNPAAPPDWVKKLNETLRAMGKDGTTAKIQKKYH